MLKASLPMYDMPEVRAANDAVWAAMAQHLEVPPELDRDTHYRALWHDPDLLFSQTCGYPFVHEFRDKLTLVATPHYAAEGCAGPHYCSLILARETAPLEAFRGQRAAVNGPDSMSGMLALKLVFAPLAKNGLFFSRAVETGGHLNSLVAVQNGEADLCAIDAVTAALVRRHRPAAIAGLVEIARSPQVPALPYVTRAGDVERLRDALRRAFAGDELKHARDRLLLAGFSVLPPEAYDRIARLEEEMLRNGGLALL